MKKSEQYIFTCEHGGNVVPPAYAALFMGAARTLRSHRGWDPGALELVRNLGAAMDAPVFASRVTRLLVDLNRSEDAPDVFGPRVRGKVFALREQILRRHYWPYRDRVEAEIEKAAKRGPVVHVSVHTFTPVLRGVRREVDVGLLFDPRRPREARTARAWKAAIDLMDLGLRVRMNQPYKGTADGFTTHLRTRFSDRVYAGIEVEVNQKFVRVGGEKWRRVRGAVVLGLAKARMQA